MSKKLPYTPKSGIVRYIRMCFLRSRERLKVLKKAKYTCKCGRKQSRAKGKEVYVEVHHKNPIDWDEIVEYVRKEVLDMPMEVLCKECHAEETRKQSEMKRHTKIYMQHHGYKIPEDVICENCGQPAVDIHHIDPRGMGGSPEKDTIKNLIALCRPCHDKAESGVLTKEELFEIVDVD